VVIKNKFSVARAVAFVYPAFNVNLLDSGQAVVRAMRAQRCSDHEDHSGYRPCSLTDSPFDSLILFTTTTNEILFTDQPVFNVSAKLPLKRRSWHQTAQQMRTSLLASATVALLNPMRSAQFTAQR